MKNNCDFKSVRAHTLNVVLHFFNTSKKSVFRGKKHTTFFVTIKALLMISIPSSPSIDSRENDNSFCWTYDGPPHGGDKNIKSVRTLLTSSRKSQQMKSISDSTPAIPALCFA